MTEKRRIGGLIPIIVVILVLAFAAAALSRGSVGRASEVFGSDLQCVSGDFRCSDNLLQYCKQGTWTNQEICRNGCKNNACIASSSCTEESYRCLGDYVQVCIKGAWTNDQRCSYGCKAGRCVEGTLCRDGEYRCLNDYLQSCAYGSWYNKERCRSGCKEDTCIEFIAERKCTDSDGKDHYQKGIAYGTDYHKASFSETDFCLSSEDLVEYWCQDGYVFKDEYLCPDGCHDGVCVQPKNETPMVVLDMAENKTVEILPEPPVVIKMPETKGLFSRFWSWLSGMFSVQK